MSEALEADRPRAVDYAAAVAEIERAAEAAARRYGVVVD